jgi:hypothetical protein
MYCRGGFQIRPPTMKIAAKKHKKGISHKETQKGTKKTQKRNKKRNQIDSLVGV